MFQQLFYQQKTKQNYQNYLLNKGFKVVAEKSYDADDPIRESIDSSCQGITRLFVLAYEGGANRVIGDSHRIIFLPSVEKKNKKNTTLKLMEEIFMIKQLIIKKQMT